MNRKEFVTAVHSIICEESSLVSENPQRIFWSLYCGSGITEFEQTKFWKFYREKFNTRKIYSPLLPCNMDKLLQRYRSEVAKLRECRNTKIIRVVQNLFIVLVMAAIGYYRF